MEKEIASGTNWQDELNLIKNKYHVIGCWVAIVLNPIWAVSDYFIIPEHWCSFWIVRVVVALATLGGLLLRKPLRISAEILMFIPFLGIALQNAYMYSLMDVPMVQQHTFAYIALFIGAGMLVLWKPIYTIIIVVVTFIANAIMFEMLSKLSVEELLSNGGMLTGSVMIFSIVLINTRYNLTKKELIARLALAESNKQLEHKNEIIAEKNKDITDSINYAKKIQEAILPALAEISKTFPESFVLFKPKDIVSGDFFWFASINNKAVKKHIIAVVDCTGHGVPGAFMSMIGNELLNKIVLERGICQPSEILDNLHEGVRFALKQDADDVKSKDGMDLALCTITKDENNKITLEYAGANNPLFLFQNGTFEKITADKFPIGGEQREEKREFTNQKFDLKQAGSFYIFSDGYVDQFGGPRNKKFMTARFRELLIENYGKNMNEQKEILNNAIEEWKGEYEQIDDICVIGVRL
ncbi:MAG: SpoIIE family protein phosphatase [Deltaproteobacteria bacterium]|nr:SpoIIE family protein phosphatase [Deltaproteobacteria bacterium]